MPIAARSSVVAGVASESITLRAQSIGLARSWRSAVTPLHPGRHFSAAVIGLFGAIVGGAQEQDDVAGAGEGCGSTR
jgi:hypothetical protein